MIKSVLQLVGLSDLESDVYMECLRLGTQSTYILSQEMGIAEETLISLLLSLADKGFVTRVSHKRNFFRPESPTIIMEILKNTQKKHPKNIQHFQQILPDLEKLRNPLHTRPEITLYEGEEGIIAAYEDTLTSRTEILAIASIDDTETTFPEYIRKYYKRRKTAGILIRAIFPDTKMSRERQKHDGEEFRESILIDPDMLKNFPLELNVYDDKIAFFSVQESMAIIIQNKFIADGMRAVVEITWKAAEMYQKMKNKK